MEITELCSSMLEILLAHTDTKNYTIEDYLFTTDPTYVG